MRSFCPVASCWLVPVLLFLLLVIFFLLFSQSILFLYLSVLYLYFLYLQALFHLVPAGRFFSLILLYIKYSCRSVLFIFCFTFPLVGFTGSWCSILYLFPVVSFPGSSWSVLYLLASWFPWFLLVSTLPVPAGQFFSLILLYLKYPYLCRSVPASRFFIT